MIEEILKKYFGRNKQGLIRRFTNSGGLSRSAPVAQDYLFLLTSHPKELIDAGFTGNMDTLPDLVEKYIPMVETNAHDFKHPTIYSTVEFVEDFLQKWDVFRSFDRNNPGKKVSGKGSAQNMKKLEKLLMEHRVSYSDDSRKYDPIEGKVVQVRPVHSAQDVKAVFEAHPVQEEMERFPAVQEHLKHVPEKAQITDKYLTMYLEAMQGYSELNIAMFKHWLWQVKRFLYGKTVVDPIFLNIYAQQGTGKTTFIRGIYDCLSEYTYEASLSTVTSEGHADIWSEKYIVFFDELKVSSEDKRQMYNLMSNLKYLITMKDNMRRRFHTQDMISNPRTFSAISTSNKPLINTLYDDTGMRRFYEIECQAKANDKAYLQLPYIEDRDPEKASRASRIFRNIWRGIDEDRDHGYLTVELREQLEKIQTGYKRPTCIEIYEAYEASEGDVGFVRVEDGETIDKLERICVENENSTKHEFKDAMRDAGFRITSIIDYRKQITDWAREDDTQIFVYSVNNMDHYLMEHGYYVISHKNAKYLVKSMESFNESRIGR